MMSNLTNQNDQCSFTEGLVDYIYQEMAPDEMQNFKLHLTECKVCSEEALELSNVSQMISQWRTDAFDHLETPNIVYAPKIRDVIVDEEMPRTRPFSWLDAILNRPRIATIGFAFGSLIIAVAITSIVLISRNNSNEIVRNTDRSEKVANVNAPGDLNSPSDAIPADGRETLRESSETSSAAVVDNNTSNKNDDEPIRVRRPQKATATASSVRRDRRVGLSSNDLSSETSPRLSQYEEYKDESIRLSDLMDDYDEFGAS